MNLALLINVVFLCATIVFSTREGTRFDWSNSSKGLGPKLINGSKFEEIDTNTALANATTIALYFSMHSCPPCRKFTPQLADLYTNSWKKQGIEIIFMSVDDSEDEFKQYYNTMPWLSSSYDVSKNGGLLQSFGYSGVPSMVLLDGQTSELITKDGRGFASSSGSPLTFQLIGLKNEHGKQMEVWNGKTCSVVFNKESQKFDTNMQLKLKAENLKPRNDIDIGEPVDVGMAVLVHGTKDPKFHGLKGKTDSKAEENKFIVSFQISVEAKNLKLIV